MPYYLILHKTELHCEREKSDLIQTHADLILIKFCKTSN